METPFSYGRIAEKENFTNRNDEVLLLTQYFNNLINTTIVSPRRWGKTSLVNEVTQSIMVTNKNILVCHVDIFNCCTEEQFYIAYANAILKISTSAWEEFVAGVKKYLGRLTPIISFSDTSQTYELSFGINFKDNRLSFNEILDLPQTIANDIQKKIVVCIDEFQNVNEYEESLAFQRKLRSHWQKHSSVCYCLYGSKRHILLDIFNNYEMPFYKFGEIIFLQRIKREDWIAFISNRFSDTGKEISQELCRQIADLMKNHPYYTQQLSQQVWLRTTKKCTAKILNDAFSSLIGQLSLLFTNIIDTLTSKQINFLIAVADGVVNFSSMEVLEKYKLGTSANIKNHKKATLDKDLIDILPGNIIGIQDPAFEYWLLIFIAKIPRNHLNTSYTGVSIISKRNSDQDMNKTSSQTFNKKYFTCFFILLLSCFVSISGQNDFQHQKDSLVKKIEVSQGDEKLDTYAKLIASIFYLDEVETVMKYLSEYEIEALKQGENKKAAACRGNLITLLSQNNLYEQLLERADDDLMFIAKQKAWNYYFKAYNAFIMACLHTGQDEKLLEEAKKCYEQSKYIDAPEAKVWPLYIMGNVYLWSKRYNEAEKYFKQCIQAGNNEACNDVKMTAYSELSQAYYNQDKNEELGELLPAWEADMKKLGILEKESKRLSALTNFYSACLRYYLAIEDYDKLEQYCKLMEDLNLNMSEKTNNIRFYRQEIAFSRGDYSKALEYAEERYNYFTSESIISGQQFALRDKATALAYLGKPEECVTAFEQMLEISDSIANRDFNAQLDELRTIYEVDKITEEKDRNRNYFLFFLTLCTLLVILLVAWIYYSKQLDKKNRTMVQQIKALQEQQEQTKNLILFEIDPCPDDKIDKLCLEIHHLLIKEKAYLNPLLGRDEMIAQLGTNKKDFLEAFQKCFKTNFSRLHQRSSSERIISTLGKDRFIYGRDIRKGRIWNTTYFLSPISGKIQHVTQRLQEVFHRE